jgi:hypothetical protein
MAIIYPDNIIRNYGENKYNYKIIGKYILLRTIMLKI